MTHLLPHRQRSRPAQPTPGALATLLVHVHADLLVILDRSGRFRHVSSSARRILGYPAGTELSSDYRTFVHPHDLPLLQRALGELPTQEPMTLFPVRILHHDGHWLHFEVTAIDLSGDPEVGGITITARNITAQHLAERRASCLQRVAEALVSCSTLEQVVDVILIEALEVVGAYGGTVSVLDEANDRLKVVGSVAQRPEVRRAWQFVPLGLHVPLTQAVRTRGIVSATATEIEREYPALWAARPPGLKAVTALPLIVEGRVVGALGVHFGVTRAVEPAEQAFLTALAGLCAHAIDRALAHDRLRASEARYRKLTRYGRDMITVVAADGTFLYDTEVIEHILGYAQNELMNHVILDYVHPEDLPEVMNAIARSQSAPGPVEVTYRFRHKGGHWVWLESVGADHTHEPDIGGILVNSRDVTQRQMAREALGRTQVAFEQLFSANPLPMFVFDLETLRFLEVNDAAISRYGYARDEFLRMTVADIHPPADLPAVLPAVRARSNALGDEFTVARHVLRGGREIQVEVRTHALDFQGRPAKLTVVEDVTVRLATVRALEESERKFRMLAENSSNLICTYTPGGANVYISPASRRMLGYEPDELRSREWQEVLHPEDYPRFREAFGAVTAHTSDITRFELRFGHRDGHWVWTDTTFRLIRDARTHEVREIQSSSLDITARKHAELQLHEQLERSQQLVDLTFELEMQHEPSEVAREALERCLRLTEFTGGYYVRIDGPLSTVMLTRGEPREQIARLARQDRVVGHEGPLREALLSGQPVFTRLGQDPVSEPPRDALAGFESMCALPVFANGELRGVFVLLSGAAQVAPASQRLLKAIAERVGVALERSLHVTQLNASREETLRAIGLVLEYRDYETAGHTDRVARLTERLGRAVGLSGGDLDVLRWGAYLHDTGKVSIPDSILLKPGRLTPEEFEAVKLHTTIGYEMLCRIPSLPSEALGVVLHHHEKWDGSGYPARLSGADIPLAARIFALVDVFDALTSERPYKRAWSQEEALAEIERTAGSHFDPDLAAAFVRMMRAPAGHTPED